VVAVPDPRQPDRLLLKRVRSTSYGLVDVRGDNEGASTDSRDFGLIPRSSVIGRAVYRYAPAGRAGWLSE
jgi:type IV secretory pathway protease TraF